ncbi:flippase-like domain-containing protein [Qipengyuania sp. 1XM1-15A]|uniref:lysylphosphatidylglycerol synthase transmembrane domain-containing protein n=1 Tax=Qipengyuania xiamenensis TaxID=2867237 RepID=UPI001C86B89F|nr:lysylphosphatidylglycerol synthase transmembrane domain-containing protein [Qipengyuania xiamenensis]MBX7532213.1 flippase-like domain-containing protein [Qipengyuania xiamenensis]
MSDSVPSTGAAATVPPKRNLARLAIGLALAGALLWWLFTSFSVLEADVWTSLGRHPWAIGGIAFATAFAMVLASTIKWQMLLRRSAPDLARSVGFDRLFAYTAASSALGQIVPPYIAGPAVRGMAMKSQHNAGFGRSAILAGYEQVFDVVTLVIGGIAALALLVGGFGGWAGVLAFVVTLALASAAVYLLPERFRPARLAAVLPQRWSTTRRIKESVEAGSAAGLDAPRLLGHLTALSSLRYGALVARTFGIGIFLLPMIPWQTVALGFGAVQLSALAALTPGNLGITELGWSAMTLVTDAATMGEFVAFALALRVSGLIASGTLAVLSLLWLRRP